MPVQKVVFSLTISIRKSDSHALKRHCKQNGQISKSQKNSYFPDEKHWILTQRYKNLRSILPGGWNNSILPIWRKTDVLGRKSRSKHDFRNKWNKWVILVPFLSLTKEVHIQNRTWIMRFLQVFCLNVERSFSGNQRIQWRLILSASWAVACEI